MGFDDQQINPSRTPFTSQGEEWEKGGSCKRRKSERRQKYGTVLGASMLWLAKKKKIVEALVECKTKENQDKFSLKKGKRIRKMSFSKIRPNATGQRYGDSDLAPPQPRSGFGQPPPSSDPNAHLRHAVQGGPGAAGSWMGPQHPIFQSQPPSASPPSGSSGDIAPPSPAVGGFFFPVPQQEGRVPRNPGASGALIPEARYDPRFPGDQGPAIAAPPPATWMRSPQPSFGTLGGAPLRLGDPDDDQLQPFAPQMMPHASRGGGAFGMRGGAGRGSGPSSGNQFYY